MTGNSDFWLIMDMSSSWFVAAQRDTSLKLDSESKDFRLDLDLHLAIVSMSGLHKLSKRCVKYTNLQCKIRVNCCSTVFTKNELKRKEALLTIVEIANGGAVLATGWVVDLP